MSAEGFIPFFTVLGAVGAGLAALLSALATAIGKRVGRRRVSEAVKESRDYKGEIRLNHVSLMLSREIDRLQFFSIASNLLIFSQFVIGGVLASSFVTRSLGEFFVGILGLLVLLSSLVNQHFRPDLLKRASSEKLKHLRSLKRHLEDQLYILTRKGVDDDELINLRLSATKTIERIEDNEMGFLNNEKEERGS